MAVAGPDAAAVVMEIDVAAFVGRFEGVRWRTIPRQISDRLRDLPFTVEIVVAQDQKLSAADRVEEVANVFGVVADREVANDVEDVGSRDAVIDPRDDGYVHGFDAIEGASRRAMAENAVVTEVKVGRVKFPGEGHEGLLKDRHAKADPRQGGIRLFGLSSVLQSLSGSLFESFVAGPGDVVSPDGEKGAGKVKGKRSISWNSAWCRRLVTDLKRSVGVCSQRMPPWLQLNV